MPSTTFVARRPGPFSALVQAAEIGGVTLEPLAPVRTHDQYYDTTTGDLLRYGLALRVQEQDGRRVVGLRPVETRVEPVPGDVALEGPDPPGRGLTVPPGALADAIRAVVGDAALEPLLSLRQYRTPRIGSDGGQRLGVLSFDVVVYEVPGTRVVSNEVEIEDENGLLARLAAVFGGMGLEPERRSTFARALLRHVRPLGQPVLLLPDEASALERAALTGPAQVQQRARVVLLDARGFRPDTIAAQTGMSMARVKHWRQRFREIRLGVLEPEPAPSQPAPSQPQPPPATAERRSVEPDVPLHAEPEPPQRALAGDGWSGDPASVDDMAELLELFSPSSPDTPMFAGEPDDGEADDEDSLEEDSLEAVRVSGPHRGEPDDGANGEMAAARRSPYPLVLGPVSLGVPPLAPPHGPSLLVSKPVSPSARWHEEPRAGAVPASPPATAPSDALRAPPASAPDSFADVDLEAHYRDSGAPPPSVRERTLDDASAGDGVRETAASRVLQASAERAATRRVRPPRSRGGEGRLDGDTLLADAARRVLGEQLAHVEARADAFRASRAPSAARALLAAAQRLRLGVETFGQTLPRDTGRHLARALRPLADDLSAGLDHARGVALAPHRRDLAWLSRASLASAAERLGSPRHQAWTARTHRLLAHLDDAFWAADVAEPPADDWAGEPGDAPTPTRLRHMLGSALWTRFEAICAFEDALEQPDAGIGCAPGGRTERAPVRGGTGPADRRRGRAVGRADDGPARGAKGTNGRHRRGGGRGDGRPVGPGARLDGDHGRAIQNPPGSGRVGDLVGRALVGSGSGQPASVWLQRGLSPTAPRRLRHAHRGAEAGQAAAYGSNC